jgi:hypothetical protein
MTGYCTRRIITNLANLSRQLPIAISIVSPNIRYFPIANDITCSTAIGKDSKET